jgi:hypothetical protein
MGEPTQPKPDSSGWEMPEPVFRTTEGKTPGSTAVKWSLEDEIPTETGIREKEREEAMTMEKKDAASATSDPDGQNAIEKKERGKNLNATMTIVFIGFALLVLIAYLMWAYVFTSSTPAAPPI